MATFSHEELAFAVAQEVESPDKIESVQREIRRIVRSEGGSPQLSGELILIASIIVQVCAVVIQIRQVIIEQGSHNIQKNIQTVINKIVENTGDDRLRYNPEVLRIAESAVKKASEKST